MTIEEMNKAIADSATRNALEIYERDGEQSFRNFANFMGLDEQATNECVKDLKKLEKGGEE